MIALDTNLLVRFLVVDDEKQSKKAKKMIEGAVSRGEQLYVSEIVMCETVWVLSSAYRFPRSEIVNALTGVVCARNLVFDSTDRLAR